uniref:Uncharacterized protein n=1 Tax=Arundo donax TaxID=35708 RepID=A0A0A9A8M2_ARUDO
MIVLRTQEKIYIFILPSAIHAYFVLEQPACYVP